MQRKYIDFKKILEDPVGCSKQWIQSTARLKTNVYYSTQAGGGKYLFDLETTNGQNAKLIIWEAPPSWIPYPETSETLLKIVQGVDEEKRQIRRLFLSGNEVFFEGYLVFMSGVIWINIERILIASPSISIGPREIIGMLSCPRKYYLDYVKNVGGNILKWPDKNITRGNLVHTIIEFVVSNGDIQKISASSFGEKKDWIRNLLKEQLDGDYRMDAALHVLADTPLFDVEKDVINRLISAFGDEELAPYFTGKDLRTECMVNQISGFSGTVDFVIEGHPFELKTATHISPDHVWQLKIYLITTLLESGINNGCLVYSTRTDPGNGKEPSKIHHFTITNEEIDQILYARHQVLLQRRGMLLPDTFHRDCLNCRYAAMSDHALQRFWPACQYYCQTERHWECYEMDEKGNISSECFLVNTCPVRNHYFEVANIDHFNKLRQAIMSENDILRQMSLFLRELPPETLRACGQKIEGLHFETTNEEGILFRSSESIPCLDCIPGDQILISTSDGLRYMGIFLWSGSNSLLIRITGTVPETFLNTEKIYSLTKDYSENRSMRYLLKVIDNIQRGIHRQLPKYSKGKILERRDLIPYQAKNVANALEERYIVALQTTNQSSVVEQCKDIIQHLPRPCQILVVLQDPVEIKNFVESYPKKHEILVIDRKSNFEKGASANLISEGNSPADIAEKIGLSPIIVTTKGFLRSSGFFEKMHISQRKVPFDYIIVTSAEEYYEPHIYHLRSLAYHTLLIGDAYRANLPIRSRDARNSGLGVGPFSELVQYDSYFFSNDYRVFNDPFVNLPVQIKSALEHTSNGISVKKSEGSVTFVNVEGAESGEDFVKYLASMEIKPSDGTRYRIVLEPQNEISISSMDSLLDQLGKQKSNKLTEGSRISICDVPFLVSARNPLGAITESGENFEVVIKLPIRFSETLEELMYSNEDEAQAIINLLKAMDPKNRAGCVIITPFISQVSKIKSLLYNSNLSDIPVLLPYQAGRKSNDISIISFVCSGNERILRYPLTCPEVLYTILTSSKRQLILVGSRDTLRQSRILNEIIDAPETVKMVNPSVTESQ